MSDSIWDWVYDYLWDLDESGDSDMSKKLDAFSSIAYDKDQKAVEAAFPELVAFARQKNNKWLEIYLRHWRLQAHVNTNLDPRPLVPEVLDLLAFCQEEDAKTCPQSTCVIDDITDIYAAIDAPGFAPERRDMLIETLETLSPQQECYTCMSMSLVDACVDLGDGAQALKVWDKAKKKRSDMSENTTDSHFHSYNSPLIVRAMIDDGKYERAIDLISKATPPEASGIFYVNCLKVQALIGLGDVDVAKALFQTVPDTDIEDTNVEQYVSCVRKFSDVYMSDKAVMNQAATLSKFSQDRGRIREAFDAASLAFDIALNIDDKDICDDMLKLMETNLADLNRPLGADETLEAAMAAIN